MAIYTENKFRQKQNKENILEDINFNQNEKNIKNIQDINVNEIKRRKNLKSIHL